MIDPKDLRIELTVFYKGKAIGGIPLNNPWANSVPPTMPSKRPWQDAYKGYRHGEEVMTPGGPGNFLRFTGDGHIEVEMDHEYPVWFDAKDVRKRKGAW